MNRALPTARTGGPRFLDHHHQFRRLAGVAMAGVLSLGLVLNLASPARADSLDDQKKQVQQQLNQSKQDLDEYNQEALAAAAAYTKSQADLAKAQSALAAARTALAAAQAKDAKRAAELKAAQVALAKAKAAAQQAAAEVAAWEKETGSRVRATMQQQSPLADYATLLTNMSLGDLNNRGQWAITVMDTTSSQMDRLRQLKLAKDSAQTSATQAEKRVAALRQQAAQDLAKTQSLAAAAAKAEQDVSAANAANAKAKAAADSHVKEELARQAQLASESSSLDARIAARLAAQKAAAAKAARDEAARKAAAKRAKSSSSRSNSGSSNSSGNSGSSSSSSGLIYPANAPITSPYGMRLHPVLGIWKLHDGTDFGAECNAPILAAASGTVTEEYYNAGYGNRLIVDHGLVNGKYMTTSYNHATRYIVGVGDHVRQGQVVGYVGTTGYSTGCHLHFMLWVNGTLVNPMNYL